ncbi:MAG TPA: hypothetical protein VFA37_10645 [Gaiellaceae bacterium]|nr:hypothetical protein [Gaiellaceae bacterium]
MADWVTISALASAGGTLVLAGVTVASVRSANRAARVAEQSLLAAQRPLLVPSRLDDVTQKVGFADDVWLHVEGSAGAALVTDDGFYLAASIRNIGTGIALLHGWHVYPEVRRGTTGHAPVEDFHRLTRDLYVAPGDIGFWQGVSRDPSTDEYAAVRAAIEANERLTVDVLYGDFEGGQRVITRFGLSPLEETGRYRVGVGHHWYLDRPEPRER